ncbi:MAG: hypothetical protein AABY64_10285 [Bdellovibrionota bacterium]
MTMIKKILKFFLLTAIIVGCTTTNKSQKKINAGDLDEASSEPQAAQLRNLFEMNENGLGNKSLPLFREFQAKNPTSIYFQAARYGEAWSLEQTEALSEALQVYQSVMDLAKSQWPRLYARSLYRSSFVYETLGEDVKLVATLMEARGLREDLPPEVALAEVPSRLSMIYAKINRPEEAQKYLKEADQGLRRLLATQKISNEWLAQMYFQMGSLKLSSMNADNLTYFVQSQKTVQRYLLSSLSLNDSVWSEKSFKKITENYSLLWNQIESYKENSNTDSFDRIESRRQQFLILGEYLKMVSEALQLKPLDEQRMNIYQTKTFNFFEEAEKKTYDLLYSKFDRMSLTEEALRLNDIRRPGKVLVNDFFPNEKE